MSKTFQNKNESTYCLKINFKYTVDHKIPECKRASDKVLSALQAVSPSSN